LLQIHTIFPEKK